MRFPGVPARILVAATVLTLALVGLVVREGMARAQGQEVRLEMAGYDPRSLLSGHYVQFQLRSELPAGAPCPAGSNDFGQAAQWIALRGAGDHHVPSGAAASRAAAARLGALVVRGRLFCDGPEARSGERREGPTSVSIDLGVDRAHFDQRQAEALERALRARGEDPPPAFVVVSIGRDGRARLKGLIVGGRRSDLDWL